MYDEHENKPIVESQRTDETPLTENGGIKVYERPERRVLPVWIWLAALLSLALIGWFVLQSLL